MTSVGRHPPTKKKNLFDFYDELNRFKLGVDVSIMEMTKREPFQKVLLVPVAHDD